MQRMYVTKETTQDQATAHLLKYTRIYPLEKANERPSLVYPAVNTVGSG